MTIWTTTCSGFTLTLTGPTHGGRTSISTSPVSAPGSTRSGERSAGCSASVNWRGFNEGYEGRGTKELRDIDIVGFSRGAATALDFCHCIQERGIPQALTA